MIEYLKGEFKDTDFSIRRIETVGAKVGKDLKLKGTLSVISAIIMMLIYISFRFDFWFGLGAIIALIHDVLICLSAISISGLEIDLTTIAALLTVVGYSVNDTIIVSDRIRENVRRSRGKNDFDIVNESVNQTISRTILTSGTTLLVPIALLIFGGGAIYSFAFILTIGFITGTYSSIYIACPVVLYIKPGTGMMVKRK